MAHYSSRLQNKICVRNGYNFVATLYAIIAEIVITNLRWCIIVCFHSVLISYTFVLIERELLTFSTQFIHIAFLF